VILKYDKTNSIVGNRAMTRNVKRSITCLIIVGLIILSSFQSQVIIFYLSYLHESKASRSCSRHLSLNTTYISFVFPRVHAPSPAAPSPIPFFLLPVPNGLVEVSPKNTSKLSESFKLEDFVSISLILLRELVM
jgi:hypothetical protein